MAKSSGTITKIYELRTRGFDEINKELQQIVKRFDEIKKAKLSTAVKTQAFAPQDVQGAQKYNAELIRMQLEHQRLIIEEQRLVNEQKAVNLSRQAAINQQRAAKAGNDAEAGSIFLIRKEISELNAALIRRNQGGTSLVDFRGQKLSIESTIAKLKELISLDQAYRRQFAKDKTLVGEYTTGILNAFKNLGLDNLIGGQITKAQARIQELNGEFDKLQSELKQTKAAGGDTRSIELQMIKNRNEVFALNKELGGLNNGLRGAGSIGNQITSSIANGFKAAKGQLVQFVTGYLGFQAAFRGVVSGINTAKELSDATTQLEVNLDLAAGGAAHLVDELAKLDTRTKLVGLEDIANIAVKAGVSEENLVKVVGAIDKIKIAFGEDFGSVEEGTESLVKLVNIFEGTDQVTGENLLRVGNAVRSLANETVASVPFLNDFSKRMAGLKGISDISLPAVLGLASGFEQFGQSSEVAGTALTKVIPALARDTEKFARVAGVTREEFSALINTNPAEALIRVSEGLTRAKGGLEEIAVAFADSELGAGRIAAILGTLGQKSDDFRKAINLAGKSYKDTSNIIDAFNAKNTNLASTLDKISKAFSDAANSKAFQATINAIAVGVLFLINNLPALVTIIGLYAAGWALANGALILQNAQLLIMRVALPILTLLTGSYSSALVLYTRTTTAASAATARLLALMGNPVFKIFALLIGAVVLSVKALGDGINTAVGSVNRLAAAEKILSDVNREAAKEINEVKSKTEILVKIINDHTLAETTRADALVRLKEVGEGWLDQLTLENIATAEGARILGNYNDQLERSIRGKALDARRKKAEADAQELQNAQFQIAEKQLRGEAIFEEDLPEAIRERVLGSAERGLDKTVDAVIDLRFGLTEKQLQKATEVIDAAINEKLAEISGSDAVAKKFKQQDLEAVGKILGNRKFDEEKALRELKEIGELFDKESGVYKEAEEKYIKAIAETQKVREEFYRIKGEKLPSSPGGTAKPEDFGAFSLQGLQAALKNVEKEIAATIKLQIKEEEKQKKLDALRKIRDELERRILDLTGGKPKRDPGSRLSGADKDRFKDIEAARDADLRNAEAALVNEERFLQEQLKLRTEEIDKKIALVKSGSAEELSELLKLGQAKLNLEIDTNQKILEARAKTPEQRTENEVAYLNEVYRINVEAIERKRALLDGSNAEERRLKEALSLEQIKLERDTNDRIFAIRQQAAEDRHKQILADIEFEASKVTEDPVASPVAQAQARVTADNAIIAEHKRFNAEINRLEKENAQRSLANSKSSADAVKNAQVKLLKDLKGLRDATLEEIRLAGERERARADIDYELLRQKILDNDKITAEQRERQLERLARIHKFTIISIELETLTQEFQKIAEEYRKGLVTEEAYLKAKKAMEEKYSEFKASKTELGKDKVFLPSSSTTQTLITEDVAKLFNFEKESPEFALLGEVLAQSFDLAKEAMNSYFDAERNRIQQSLEFNLQRLDIEKEQRIARAQSQVEVDSLEREYASKRRTEERKAHEQLKKLKLAEAKIALATELANIGVAAAAASAAYGPGAPVAYAVLYSLMAGLAIGRFAINVANISREKFERGGVPKRGGEFGGKPHSQGGTPFKYKGQEYEAEVKELAIVRTKDAARDKHFTITGTQMQVASAANVIGGGVDFAPGAKIKEEKRKKFARGGKLDNKQPVQAVQQEEFIETTRQVYHRTMSELDIVSANRKQAEYKRFETGEINKETLQSNLVLISRQQAHQQIEISNRFFDAIQEQKTATLIQQQTYFNEKSTELKASLDTKKITSESYEKSIASLENKHAETQTSIHNSFAAVVEELSTVITGKQLTAAVEESAKRYKVSGTQEQIVSSINTVNGGINFSPGGIIKFASGGQVPLRGGSFGGHPHEKGGTPFIFKGVEYEAEVDELAIIRTRDADKTKQYALTGNFMQLASMLNELGGGKSFAKTAPKQRAFQTGGALGDTLQAPLFTPAGSASNYISNTNNTTDIQALRDDFRSYAEAIQEWRDRFKVVVVEKEITEAQNRSANKASIGTL